MVRQLRVWFEFTRPKTLVVSILPLVAAVPIAASSPVFSLWRGLLFMATVLTLQIACNFTNDYYDQARGSDNTERQGPKRALQAKLLSRVQVRRAIIGSFVLAALLIILLVLSVRLAAVWNVAVGVLGAVAMGCAFFYTGGPYPLAYKGLGEVTAFIFFGPVIVLTALFFMGSAGGEFQFMTEPLVLSGAAALACSYGAFAYMLITVNNLRDIDSDRKSGKQTLTVRLGQNFAYVSLYGSIILMGLAPLMWGLAVSNLWLLLPSAVAMLGLAALGKVLKRPQPALNKLLGHLSAFVCIYTFVLVVVVF